MTDPQNDIQNTAAKFGLSLDQLRDLLNETDALRGLLTPADLESGLSQVVQLYVNCMGAAAERFVDPAERLVADRVVSATTEMIVAQLQAAPHIPN